MDIVKKKVGADLVKAQLHAAANAIGEDRPIKKKAPPLIDAVVSQVAEHESKPEVIAERADAELKRRAEISAADVERALRDSANAFVEGTLRSASIALLALYVARVSSGDAPEAVTALVRVREVFDACGLELVDVEPRAKKSMVGPSDVPKETTRADTTTPKETLRERKNRKDRERRERLKKNGAKSKGKKK
jgi:hypothetical protein